MGSSKVGNVVRPPGHRTTSGVLLTFPGTFWSHGRNNIGDLSIRRSGSTFRVFTAVLCREVSHRILFAKKSPWVVTIGEDWNKDRFVNWTALRCLNAHAEMRLIYQLVFYHTWMPPLATWTSRLPATCCCLLAAYNLGVLERHNTSRPFSAD